MQFTRREKHVAIIGALSVLIIIFSNVDQSTLNGYELLWLLFFVVPIGIYIITDPERRKNTQ